LLAAIFSVSFLLLVVFIINRVALTRTMLAERDTDAINTLGQFVADEMLNDLDDRDYVHLRQVLALSKRQPNVTVVSVLDGNRTVTYSTEPRLEGRATPYRDTADLWGPRNGTFYKAFALDDANPSRGYVQLGYSVETSRRALRVSLRWDLVIAIGMLLSVLCIAWFITGLLLRPLHEMKNAAHYIAGGDFGTRLEARSRDIIGELALALNQMAEQLGDLTANMHRRIEQATLDLEKSNRELQERTAQLEESNRKLMELDRLKSDFVSMVSHELRTPLTSIIGFARTLMTLQLSPEQKVKFLSIIEAEGKRLAALVEEYLDISKIESGCFTLKLESVALHDVAKGVVEPLRVNPAVHVQLCFPPDFPAVHGDAARLRRVLLNLLDNAVRYSPPEEPVVVTGEERADSVCVSVQDRGPGLPQDELPKVFGKFYRGKDRIAERSRGSGLGLAIAKAIVEAHHGRIWVESEYGHGARFTFCIPKPPPSR